MLSRLLVPFLSSCCLLASVVAQGNAIQERLDTLKKVVAKINKADSLRPDRNQAACAAITRGRSAAGKLSGNDRFIEIATSIQYAFDGEEAPQIRASYTDRVGGDRNSWAAERDRAHGDVEQAVMAMGKGDKADSADVATTREASEMLKSAVENNISDPKSREVVVRAIGKLQDRLSTMVDQLDMIRTNEDQERDAIGNLAESEGQRDGASHHWDTWESIATQADSDEGPWARHGTDKDGRGKPGWEKATRSQVIDPAVSGIAKSQASLGLARQALTKSRSAAQATSQQLSDIVSNISDLLALAAPAPTPVK